MSVSYNLIGSYVQSSTTHNFNLLIKVGVGNVATLVNGTIDNLNVVLLNVGSYQGNDNVFDPNATLGYNFSNNGLSFQDTSNNKYCFYNNTSSTYVAMLNTFPGPITTTFSSLTTLTTYNLSGSFTSNTSPTSTTVSFNFVLDIDLLNVVNFMTGTLYFDGVLQNFELIPPTVGENNNLFYPNNAFGNNFSPEGLAFGQTPDAYVFNFHTTSGNGFVTDTYGTDVNVPLTITETCFPEFTEILLFDGTYKQAKDIKIGDLTPKGPVKTVIRSKCKEMPYFYEKYNLIISVGHRIKYGDKFLLPKEIPEIKRCTNEILNKFGMKSIQDINYINIELENSYEDRWEHYLVVNGGLIIESFSTKKYNK